MKEDIWMTHQETVFKGLTTSTRKWTETKLTGTEPLSFFKMTEKWGQRGREYRDRSTFGR